MMIIRKMKRYLCILLLVNITIVLCLAGTGCRTNPSPVSSLDDLISRLSESGLNVEVTDQIVRNVHLSVEGRVMMVEGEDIQLFEYADVNTAEMEFESLTGSGPGLVFFEENEPPLSEEAYSRIRVYHFGRFTLLYHGDDTDITTDLRASLGNPSQIK